MEWSEGITAIKKANLGGKIDNQKQWHLENYNLHAYMANDRILCEVH